MPEKLRVGAATTRQTFVPQMWPALLGCGKSAFRIAPPLVLDEYDVDTGMGILEECLGEED